VSRRLRVLLLGGTGQIGTELRSLLASVADVTAPSREQLDCCRTDKVCEYVTALQPDAVLNAAAFTRVDDAETERAEAAQLNAELPGILASACERIGASLVHFSTDYVFGGNASRPYREDDPTGPVNWYGATKLAGELAALSACERIIVLRTSWVYGRTGRNFFRTVLRLAREREEVRIVDDQCGAPTWAHEIASGTVDVLTTLGADAAEWSNYRGVYHLSAGGMTSWFEFAERILSSDPDRPSHTLRRLTPIRSSEYPTLAARPAYSVLDSSLINDRLGIRLLPWDVQLERLWSS